MYMAQILLPRWKYILCHGKPFHDIIYTLLKIEFRKFLKIVLFKNNQIYHNKQQSTEAPDSSHFSFLWQLWSLKELAM